MGSETPPPSRLSPTQLIVALCVAEVFSMIGVAAFPALLPTFLTEWQLTNTDAGWLNGIYYAGYLAAVPVLVSLTDRAPTRRIYYLCMVLTTLANAGFALLVEGFWLEVTAGLWLKKTVSPKGLF